MKETLEQNGKPSAINLITESDNKFLKNLERQARKEALAAADREKIGSAGDEAASGKDLEQTNMTEEEKAAKEAELKKAEESESDDDEVGKLIEKEEEEAKRAEKAALE